MAMKQWTTLAAAGAAAAAAFATVVEPANPLVPHTGMADPHVHIFDDFAYMYSTHDELSGNGTCCTGPWWVWRSSDLVTWVQVGELNDFSWTPKSLVGANWATDAARRADDRRYFWYVSIGGDQVGVATSSTPAGPWDDPLGTFLLPKSLGESLDPPSNIRDPGVLQDTDGSNYLVFGACSGEKQPTVRLKMPKQSCVKQSRAQNSH